MTNLTDYRERLSQHRAMARLLLGEESLAVGYLDKKLAEDEPDPELVAINEEQMVRFLLLVHSGVTDGDVADD